MSKIDYDLRRRDRRSIRYQGYDYSQNGAYFVTICIENRQCLLGEIKDGKMILNDAGRLVQKWWMELSNKFLRIELDAYVIMPNHFHGIISIVESAGADLRVRPGKNADRHIVKIIGADACTTKIVGADLCVRPGKNTGRTNTDTGRTHRCAPTVGEMVQWFKTMSTNEYIRNVKNGKFPPFEKSVWQRNYWERIIRDEKRNEPDPGIHR